MIFYFECNFIEYHSIEDYKKNEMVNKFWLAGDKFMPKMHLKQPGCTYSAYGPFTKKQRKNS